MAIYPISYSPKHLRQKYRYGVGLDGFVGMYFQKIDRPKITFDEVVFSPAGSATNEKLPGKLNYGDIVLEKGVSALGTDNAVFLWMKQQIDFLSGVGQPPSGFLRDLTIEEGDRSGAVVATFVLQDAWVKEYDGGELNGDSDNLVDSITIAYNSIQTP